MPDFYRFVTSEIRRIPDMLKNLVPIVAATLLVLFVLVSVVPMLHLFETEDAVDEVAVAQMKWQAHAVESYEFVITKYCACDPPGNIPVKIVVRDYLTIAAYDSRLAFDAGRERIDDIPQSVTDLFDLLNVQLNGQSAVVNVEFDDDYGFPVNIELDSDATNDGGEITYSIEHFRVGESPAL